MKIDLSQAMHDAASTSTALRHPLAAGPVLQRIRRRRALVTTGQSAVGVAAAGAVAFGAIQVSGGRGETPVPPATPTASATPTPSVSLAAVTASGPFVCGAPVPTILDPAGDADLHLEPTGGVAPEGGQPVMGGLSGLLLSEGGLLALDAELVNGTADTAAFGAHDKIPASTWVAQDGVVVGTLSFAVTLEDLGDPDGLVDLTGPAGTRWSQPFLGTLVACSSDDSNVPLPAGAYELYLDQQLTVYDVEPVDGEYVAEPGRGPVSVAAGPYAFTIAPADGDPVPTEEPDATAPPADPRPAAGDLLITTSGLGPLTVGQPPVGNRGEAMIRFDPEFCREMDPALPGEWRPVPFYEQQDADGNPTYPFSVEADDDAVYRVDVRSGEPATAEGIRIGSTPAELRAAYPDLTGPVSGVSSEVWSRGDVAGTMVFEVVTSPEGFPEGVTEPSVVSIRVFAPGLDAAFPIWQTDNTAGTC